jgi:hypothetical protein
MSWSSFEGVDGDCTGTYDGTGANDGGTGANAGDFWSIFSPCSFFSLFSLSFFAILDRFNYSLSYYFYFYLAIAASSAYSCYSLAYYSACSCLIFS